MKNFIKKHSKVFIFCTIVVLLTALLSTAAITNGNYQYLKSADDIDTISKPTGEVVAKGIDVSRYHIECYKHQKIHVSL